MNYTDEMIDFFKSYVPGHHYKEIIEEFNNRFRVNLSTNQIKYLMVKSNSKTGFNGHFPKGNIPFNKGMKQADYMSAEAIEKTKATRLKKGHEALRIRPIGSTRVSQDGYVEIKTSEFGRWERQCVLVYKETYGEIPPNYVVFHKNGISTDDRPENLMLLSRSALARLNQDGLFKVSEATNESAILLAQLKAKITEAKNKNRSD